MSDSCLNEFASVFDSCQDLFNAILVGERSKVGDSLLVIFGHLLSSGWGFEIESSIGVNNAMFHLAPKCFGNRDVGLKQTFDSSGRVTLPFADQTDEFAITNFHDFMCFAWAVEIVQGAVMAAAAYEA